MSPMLALCTEAEKEGTQMKYDEDRHDTLDRYRAAHDPNDYANDDRVLSPKSAEVQRQIERLVSFRRWLEEGSENQEKAFASINTAIRILNSTLYSQTPVPVASTNSAGTASLFIDDAQIYGDIEINGNEIEYYIKGKIGDQREIFDVESMPSELMPANLLGIMYKIYERNLE